MRAARASEPGGFRQPGRGLRCGPRVHGAVRLDGLPGHGGVGVDELRLARGDEVADEERALADLPDRLAAPQTREQRGLGLGEAEQLRGQGRLALVLSVDDAGAGIGQESFGEARFARAGGAGGAEV